MSAPTHSILLADDHPVFILGLKALVERDSANRVVHVVNGGDEALELIKSTTPDLAILDVDMPGLNGLQVARTVQELNLPTKIIILTMHREEEKFNEAMDSGVYGYVLKDNAVQDILESIKTVMGGNYFISSLISGFLVKRSQRKPGESSDKLSVLTATEKKVLKMIAENLSTREIADSMFVSVNTINNHRANICRKLDIQGTNSLLVFALENKKIIFA
jgi:DNA-binding NarL/FixJ family response regulator